VDDRVTSAIVSLIQRYHQKRTAARSNQHLYGLNYIYALLLAIDVIRRSKLENL